MPEDEDAEGIFHSDLIHFRELATSYRESRFTEEWSENQDFYFGNQYSADYENSLAMWRSLTINNVIYPTVEQLHSLLTDDQSIAFVQRMAGGSYTIERILDSIIQQVWDKADVTSKISLVDKDRLMYGTGFLKCWRNEHSKNLLKIDVDRVSSWDFFPDPIAQTIEDCRFVYERERTNKADLLQKHPDKFDEIMGADGDAGNRIVSEGNAEHSTNYEPETLFVWHCYINDLLLFERNNEDFDKEASIEVRKKYPNGRYVKLLGDVVLEDKANDLPFFPYIRMPLIEIPDEFFGMSVITQMKPQQEELNKTENIILDNLKSHVNPVIRATEGVVDIDEYVHLPNSIVTLRDKDDIFDTMPGVQLPSQAFAMMSQKRDEVMAAAGVNDVTFGSGAQSSRPGTVKANFQASITRVREYTRLKHKAISEIGKMIIKIVQLHTPKDTIITLTNPDDLLFDLGDTDTQDDLIEGLNDPRIAKNLEIADIKINEVDDAFKEQLNQMIEQGQGDAIFTRGEAEEVLLKKGISKYKNDVSTGEYNYTVKTHPITVKDPDSMMELFTMLLQYGSADPKTGSPGIIDFEFVLDHLQLDGKSQLKKRLKRKERELMQIQQAQAQAQQQGEAPQGGQ